MRRKFKTYLSPGSFIRFGGKREKSAFKHRFCGKHQVRGAICPNCQKPLLRFVKFDLADARLNLQTSRIRELSLFYCWTCLLSQGEFFYRCLEGGEVEVLKYEQGACFDDFPYKSYPDYFPGSPAELIELLPLEQEILKELNAGKANEWIMMQLRPDLCEPRHQLGGEPYLVQKELRKMECCECKKEMPFFAAIGDQTLKKMGFTNNPYVQVIFYFCSKCQVIGAGHEVD